MQRIAMTIGVLALATLIDVPPSAAYSEGPWCGYTRAGRSAFSSRCDLRTYEACRAWINAQPGSWCTQNPRFQVAEKPARRKARQVQ